MRRANLLLILVACTGLVSCATWSTLEHANAASPVFFSGSRLNVNALVKDADDLRRFSVRPPNYPLLDLPGSLLLDTIVFPATGLWALARHLGTRSTSVPPPPQ